MFRKAGLYFENHLKAKLLWWQVVMTIITLAIFFITKACYVDIVGVFPAINKLIKIAPAFTALVMFFVCGIFALIICLIMKIVVDIVINLTTSFGVTLAVACTAVLAAYATAGIRQDLLTIEMLIADILTGFAAVLSIVAAIITVLIALDYAKENKLIKRHVLFSIAAQFMVIEVPMLYSIFK